MLRIKVCTIPMCVPRVAISNSSLHQRLVTQEMLLRQLAYKNTSITTNETFFNDADMIDNYYLIVVYDKTQHVALLTARYYYNKTLITKYITGENPSNSNTFSLNKYDHNDVLLIDRLSGNGANRLYRKHRSYVLLLLYIDLLRNNKHRKCIAMARKEHNEKLLTKYIRLGLNIVGSATHNGKEHWVLMGDLQKSYAQLKTATVLNTMFILIHKLYNWKHDK
jgi:hypothetical protein